jgi:hypothetical protein
VSSIFQFFYKKFKKLALNVPDVGDVLGAKISKNKGNPFHSPLFLQAPKMWRRQNRIKALSADCGFS